MKSIISSKMIIMLKKGLLNGLIKHISIAEKKATVALSSN